MKRTASSVTGFRFLFFLLQTRCFANPAQPAFAWIGGAAFVGHREG